MQRSWPPISQNNFSPGRTICRGFSNSAVYNFNAKWAFTKMAAEAPTELPKLWDWVNLPHTWNAIDGQDGGNDYYRGT